MKTLPLAGAAFALSLLAACGTSPSDSAAALPDAALSTDTVATAAVPMVAPLADMATKSAEQAEENTAEELVFFERIDAILADADRRAAFQAESRSRTLGGDLLDQAENAGQLSPKSDNGTLWGFADAAGNFVVKPQFSAVKTFSEGFAPVLTQQQKWGFINTKGVMTISPRFERVQVTGFREGRVIAVAQDTFGYINTSGKYIDGYFAVQKGKKKKRK